MSQTMRESEGRDMIGTVTISIGRCIGDEPMLVGMWVRFSDDVNALVWDYAKDVHVDKVGHVSKWKREDGTIVREDSFTWVADIGTDHLPRLREELGRFAYHYGQDAIAMTVGVTELVKPKKTRGV